MRRVYRGRRHEVEYTDNKLTHHLENPDGMKMSKDYEINVDGSPKYAGKMITKDGDYKGVGDIEGFKKERHMSRYRRFGRSRFECDSAAGRILALVDQANSTSVASEEEEVSERWGRRGYRRFRSEDGPISKTPEQVLKKAAKLNPKAKQKDLQHAVDRLFQFAEKPASFEKQVQLRTDRTTSPEKLAAWIAVLDAAGLQDLADEASDDWDELFESRRRGNRRPFKSEFKFSYTDLVEMIRGGKGTYRRIYLISALDGEVVRIFRNASMELERGSGTGPTERYITVYDNSSSSYKESYRFSNRDIDYAQDDRDTLNIFLKNNIPDPDDSVEIGSKNGYAY